jgi:aldose 1-epimerase
MGFAVTTRDATAGDRSGTVYVLADDAGTCRAEVWPFLGFNCLRWQVRNLDGTWGDLLHAAPDWETNPVPTRSGHPVLFPFPNRLRDGRFTFQGKAYQLPLNEATGKHAIHGFTPRNPWRVVGTEAGAESASITGQFQLSRDLPDSRAYWPADFVLTLTYQLTPGTIRVEAVVENPDVGPLPIGLGYHPYFCMPTAPGGAADEMVLEALTTDGIWETEGGIPTGRELPVPPGLDFRTPRLIGTTELDTLYTAAERFPSNELQPRARLSHRKAPGRLTVACGPAFRYTLLFIPPHRKAVAIEPYTCTSDAPNVADRGIFSGWGGLPSGQRRASAVEYRWDPNALTAPGVMPPPHSGLQSV